MDEPSSQELAAAIHETTNALTVILGWIERARGAASTDANTSNEEVLKALARAGRYTRDARAAMRRAIGAELPPRPPETALSLGRRAVEDLGMEATRAQVALGLDVDRRCERSLARHPDTAWQILTNLLLNAIAMSPAGGEVSLDIELTEHGQLLFRVSDDGPGVPDSMRASLFTGGVSKRAGGAGIGLRHAHTLAAECDGELRLGTPGPDDTGAVFELVWATAEDMADDELAVTAKRPKAPASLDGARVLVLEDDLRVIELLELSLSARGAVVTSVRNAQELADQLDRHTYDVMLVDLSPLSIKEGEPTGLDAALEQARACNDDIDVVVISGSVTVRPRNDVIWVRKPFEPKELVEAILKGQSNE